MFHVGQLVECVDVGPNGIGMLPNLKCGVIYTVKSVTNEQHWFRSKGDCSTGISLVEVKSHNPRGFSSFRFRLLNEQRLAVFRAMLAPAPTVKVKA